MSFIYSTHKIYECLTDENLRKVTIQLEYFTAQNDKMRIYNKT